MCGRIARSMNMAMDNSTLGRRRKFRYKFREREKEFSETNTGIGVDWIYGEAKVKKVFIIETRGNDTKILDYIFDMDPKLILPVSREVQAGFWQAVRETLPKEEKNDGDEEQQANPEPAAAAQESSDATETTEEPDPVENPVQLDAIIDEMNSEGSSGDDADGNEEVESKGVGDVASNVEAAKLAGEALGKDSSFVSDFDSMVESSDVEDAANATVTLPDLEDAKGESEGSPGVHVLDVDIDGDEEEENESGGKDDQLEDMEDGMDQLDDEADSAGLEETADEDKDDGTGLEEADTPGATAGDDELSLDDQLKLEEESQDESESMSLSEIETTKEETEADEETEEEAEAEFDSDAPSAQDPVIPDSDTEDEAEASGNEQSEEASSLDGESDESEDRSTTESSDDSHPLDPPSVELEEGDDDAEATSELDVLSNDENPDISLDAPVSSEGSDTGSTNTNEDPFEGLDEALAQSEKEATISSEGEGMERDIELSIPEDDDEGDRDERLRRKMKQWRAHQTQFKSQLQEMDKLLGPDEERHVEHPYAYSIRLGASKDEVPLWELAAGGSFLLMLTVALRHRYLHSKQQHID